MKKLSNIGIGDLVKYSEKAMRVISYSSDWYEDINSEFENQTFLVVEEVNSFQVGVYNSNQKNVQKFFLEDLEKIQGDDSHDKDSV